MYHHFVVTHPLPLILLSNESLIRMVSKNIFHGWFKCPAFSSIIVKYHANFTKKIFFKYGHENGKNSNT